MVTKVNTVDGVKGFYYGVGISMSSVFFYRALFFGLYDTGLEYLFKDPKASSAMSMWFFAQSVTISVGTLVYPIDTIRTRMIMTSGTEDKYYKNARDCVQKMLQEEGVKGFYKGFMINALHRFSNPFILVLY